MKTEIIKELRYALRSGRALILFVSFLFFAILTPVMLKLVIPKLLSGQLANELSQDISTMMDMNQLDCIVSYMSDVLEMGLIIVSFTLCGIIASEIKGNTLALPLCAGKRYEDIIGAKLLIFGSIMIAIPILALLADYGYSGLLFGFEIGVIPILYGGMLQGLYMVFILACLIMWGSFMRKPISTGFMTLGTAYGIHLCASLFGIQEWTPSGLLVEALKLTPGITRPLIISLVVTTLLIILMIILALSRLKHMEWNVRNI